MPQRLSIGATVYLVVICALGLYFAFAAVQGPSGILRRCHTKHVGGRVQGVFLLEMG